MMVCACEQTQANNDHNAVSYRERVLTEHLEPVWQDTPAVNHLSTAFDGPAFSANRQARSAWEPRELRLQFTGSGSEYFRIWIVNLLLTLVTLGLYYPWAKVRRLRYFFGNTLVDGDPLDFHGNPKTMLRGYLLVVLMFALYSLAGKLSATAGLAAFVLLMVLWPALWKSSLQFRMANTSWRGLRFAFHGSLGGAYGAVLPFFLPGLVGVGAALMLGDPTKPQPWYLYLMMWIMLAIVAVGPWLFWRLKKYQHDNYGLAHWQTEFQGGPGAFYLLGLKVLGMFLPIMFLFGAFFGIMIYLMAPHGPQAKGAPPPEFMAYSFLAYAAFWLVLLALFKPYSVARTQNLVWSRTGGTAVEFSSALRFRSLLWLSIKNWLMMVITLGLYWPFAAVATTRMRLEAVHASARHNPETLAAEAGAGEGEAAGDAAGDMFGFDIGL
jgi:uncharacterized membrane protein YjgN (DUF898 family)